MEEKVKVGSGLEKKIKQLYGSRRWPIPSVAQNMICYCTCALTRKNNNEKKKKKQIQNTYPKQVGDFFLIFYKTLEQAHAYKSVYRGMIAIGTSFQRALTII